MLALTATAGMLLAGASPVPRPPPPIYCPVVMYQDYYFALSYYVVPALSPDCPPGGVGRLRKSSTLNQKAQGAHYQPIRPQSGAWTVTVFGDDVPRSERFTNVFSTWEWQYVEADGKHWHTADVR
ncbi:hypothetical protein GCM10008957_34590 [Deinococcus ruber]|uniref:Uncharacterized protein n=2 Tax=Deinococcus ruber TaxID=1848197 RepID=A0A918FBJ3_9DEIO|nr:hypothetical protein GCM10008957_34590 [Deinococcus ruber]